MISIKSITLITLATLSVFGTSVNAESLTAEMMDYMFSSQTSQPVPQLSAKEVENKLKETRKIEANKILRNYFKTKDQGAYYDESKLDTVQKQYQAVPHKFKNDIAYTISKKKINNKKSFYEVYMHFAGKNLLDSSLINQDYFGKNDDLIRYTIILEFAAQDALDHVDLQYDLFFEGC